jgi:hypothetical protein
MRVDVCKLALVSTQLFSAVVTTITLYMLILPSYSHCTLSTVTLLHLLLYVMVAYR